MWHKLSRIILNHRLGLMLVIFGVTAFMGYQAQFVKWSFSLANIVPAQDPEMLYFKQFKQEFGEDGNILAIGIKDSAIFQVPNFRRLQYMTQALQKIRYVKDVLSLPSLQKLVKDPESKRFKLAKVFKEIPEDQTLLDSLIDHAMSLKFYSGQLVNVSNGANMVLVTIDKSIMNSKVRNDVVLDILQIAQAFEKHTGIHLRYAGLPYTRLITTVKVKDELTLFLLLSVVVTGLILLLFFRSFKVSLLALIIIGIIVIWVIGTLSLLGFEITMLTGLIPPIIVVIGIPNAVYMLNKYHQEYFRHGSQTHALEVMIKKIGFVTFITNFTTAVGFLVLIFTDIVILREFGIVAGVNILATFVVSLIMIPSVFSYLKPPSPRHLKHLSLKPLHKILQGLDVLVHRHTYPIFIVTLILIAWSAFGISKIKAVSFMADDLPEESEVIKDLRFFEEHFSGVMPLELIVDTGKKRGVQSLKNLKKINEFQTFLDSIDDVSHPLSVVNFVKASRQAFYNNNPSKYALPNSRDKGFILRYLSKPTGQTGMAEAFIDSAQQKARISLKMADIGSDKLDSLVHQVIEPKIHEIFDDTGMKVAVTGTTLLFIKGNKFLIDNLIMSMIIAFVVIALIMALLFRNVKMIVISLIPNLIPLMITGGMMGYAGIPLKPSTALIFSIAFGISVDDSLHFLAKYRQELFANRFFVPVAISHSLRETGASMIYTSSILFFGFVIFSASEFGGTVALGALTSATLLIAMLTNLIVLPALLLRFDSGKRNTKSHPLIESYPEFYEESEDEAIDLKKIKVDPRSSR